MNVEVSEMNFFLCASILYKILDNISSQKIYIAIEKCNFHRKCIVSLFYCLTHCSIKCFRFMSGGGFFHKKSLLLQQNKYILLGNIQVFFFMQL